MKEYEPELGQFAFGQPHQQFEVPEIMEAALLAIDKELDRVMWNVNQKDHESPFGNTGGHYKNETFEATAYSWDDSVEQEFNFAWRDLRISWYKYLGRGMSANKVITPEIASECLEDCLRSLREIDRAHWKELTGARTEG